MKPNIEELRKKYMANPPEGMTSRDIRNMSEDDFASGIDNNPHYKAVCEIAAAEGSEVLPICAEGDSWERFHIRISGR